METFPGLMKTKILPDLTAGESLKKLSYLNRLSYLKTLTLWEMKSSLQAPETAGVAHNQSS